MFCSSQVLAHGAAPTAYPDDSRLSADGVQLGWAMSDYGVDGAAVRAASLRAVLVDHNADDVGTQPGLSSVLGYLLLNLLSGGGGAPLDIATPRDDLDEYLNSRTELP